MVNPDWGTKHSCQNCGAKYYDLKRSPAVCPKCGTEFNPDALLKSRRAKPAAAKPAPVAAAAAPVAEKKVKAEEAETEEAVVADDKDIDVDVETDDDAAIEDAAELGEDEDDLDDVVVAKDDDKDET